MVRLGRVLGDGAERLYVVISFFLMSSAAILPSSATGAPAAADATLADSIFGPIYLVAAALIVMRPRRAIRTAMAHPLTLLLLAVAAASMSWSNAPDITVRRTIAVSATTAFGWYVVSRFTIREILQLVAAALGVAAVLSLLYGIFRPDFATEAGQSWRGVYQNKNVLARAMVFSSMAFLLLSLDQGSRRWVVLTGATLSATLVLLSRSTTGLVVLLALAFLVTFSGGLKLRATVLVPLLITGGLLVAAGLVWLWAHADAVTADVGKDATLTGRTDLWNVAITMIARRPWLGYGYGGFWRGWTGESAEFWRAVGWETPHAHNGFLDLALDLGVLGVATFVAGWASAAYKALVRARGPRTSEALAPLVILAFVLFYNLTESSILRQTDVFWVLYIVAVCASSGSDAPGAGGREPGIRIGEWTTRRGRLRRALPRPPALQG